MIKNKLLKIVSLALVVILAFSFAACEKIAEDINKKVSVEVVSFCDAKEEDFERYTNAFPNKTVEFEKDHYRLVKMNCEVTNHNAFPISFEDMRVIDTDEFYLSADAADYEPTFMIAANSSMCIDIYIYVSNDLTDEDEILAKLNELDIVLLTYRVYE